MQNINAIGQDSLSYKPKFKPDDLLLIIISSENSDATSKFNLPVFGTLSETNMESVSAQQRFQTYLVNNEGYIVLPVIGRFKIGGLTRDEAITSLKKEISKYVTIDPIITMRIINYKVSVMGEVSRPNSFNIISERITLLEALSLAGDMTIYGDRKDIVVLREINGVKTYNSIDITNADFITSPFYYLGQNDVVYVKPNQTRVNSSIIGPNLTVAISALSLTIGLIALITR